jgi:phage tail sheath gpL-like
MSISTAIGTERRSRVSGYKIKRGFYDNQTPNLPQVVVILGEANTANQASITTTAKEITSADEAGKTYGFGSPIHQVMRILRPQSGDGIGGIPTIVMPQLAAGGATATVVVWTITGNATKNATHQIVIAGRESLDFTPYSYNVVIGDTPTIIAQKIADAVNGVQGTPFIATVLAGVLTLTTKWKGLTSANATAVINNGGNAAGVTYALTSTTAGTGTVDLDDALAQFENNWYTTVINTYGESKLADLEQFNGVPDDENPTGRWQGRIFKPFMALFGSTEADKDTLALITDDADRVSQVTNVLCPAPNSPGMPWEAAANVALLFARVMQDTPHLDVNGKSYPDMPTPADGKIGDMADYNNRDFLVKKGCSTVLLAQGAYQIQDLVTTYHPADETPLQFAYCRNINLDWNVKDGYSVLETQRVKDRVLIKDNQVTDVPKAIKPSEWKASIFDYFDDLATKALINDPAFSKASLRVEISTVNPNRFETFFRYKRTGIARIESTDVEAGF